MIVYQTENFGKSYHYRSNPHTNWVMAPHIHEFSEIAFTKSGVMTVYVNGKKHLVPEKHLVMILPNRIHEYTDETDSTLRCAVFSNDHVPAFFRLIQDRDLRSPVVDFSDCFDLLEALEQTDPRDTLRLCGLLNLLCEQVLLRTDLIPRHTDEGSLLYDVIHYISQNFRQEITLQKVAKKLGYNEKYLSTVLHAMTDMNFRRFLASYRIQYAKEQLRAEGSGQSKISDIAFECGFSSINNFNRVFKEMTGMTPKEYQRKKVIGS